MDTPHHHFDKVAMLEEIRKIVSFGIRRPGYPGDVEAEQYILNRFENIGLSDTRLEPVPVNRWIPNTTRLVVGSANESIPVFAIPYTGWTPREGIQAASVYVNSGSQEDFDATEVQGKVVVADISFGELNATFLKSGAHFIHDPESTIPDGPLHCANWLITNFAAYYQAWKRGAVGFVGLLNDMPIDGCELYVPYDGYLKDLPGAWVGREDAAIVRESSKQGAPFNFQSCGETTLVDSHNVIGVIPGTTQESIIITSHHDGPFASAVEDGSGLSVLLALAESFMGRSTPLKRKLNFLAASGHFHGAAGTHSFVDRHKDDLLDHVVAAIGVEHIGEEVESNESGSYQFTGKPEVRALFMDQSQELIRIVEEEVRSTDLDRTLGVDAYKFGPEPPCDSAPFFTAGIPSVCHISGPLYLFDPHDTIDKVRSEDLPKVAEMFHRVIQRIDEIPGEDLERGMVRSRGEKPSPPPLWFMPPNVCLDQIVINDD